MQDPPLYPWGREKERALESLGTRKKNRPPQNPSGEKKEKAQGRRRCGPLKDEEEFRTLQMPALSKHCYYDTQSGAQASSPSRIYCSLCLGFTGPIIRPPVVNQLIRPFTADVLMMIVYDRE